VSQEQCKIVYDLQQSSQQYKTLNKIQCRQRSKSCPWSSSGRHQAVASVLQEEWTLKIM